MITVHGIRNCDSVRAARRWLKARGVAHELRDLRADPPGEAELARWADAVGWERLLNRRGTTWRALPAGERDGLDQAAALRLMTADPLLVKRPVVNWGGRVTVGVDEEAWAGLV